MSNEEKMSVEKIIMYILYAVPLAFGIVFVVLSVITALGIGQPMDVNTNITLIGIGLFCLALNGLNSMKD